MNSQFYKKPSKSLSAQFKLALILSIILIGAALLMINPQLIAQQNKPTNQNPEIQIKNLIEQSSLNNAFWSICVRDTNNKILFELNSQKLITPASNLKLLSSAAALDQLGGNFRFETNIYAPKDSLNSATGSLEGDLHIVGSGDPSINGPAYSGDKLFVFKKLVQQLKDKGIKKIEGNLIAHDGVFDRHFIPNTWLWSDLTYYFGAPSGALSFNNNCVDLEIRSSGGKAAIKWFPFNSNYVHIIDKQTITAPGSSFEEFYERQQGENTIVVKSKLPIGLTERESLAIHDPSAFFLDSFNKFLKEQGITKNGSLIVSSQFPALSQAQQKEFVLLAQHQSEPLAILLKELNKNSNNLYAESLLKAAAHHKYQEAGSTKNGISLIKDFCKQLKLDTTNLSIDDASGLSPNDLVSTSLLSELLVKMRQHKDAKVYLESLAIGGVDGSLIARFIDSPLNKNFIGKTGFIAGNRALTGYFTTKSSNQLIVSLATNHFVGPTSTVDQLHKKILETLYQSY